ncbi:Serpin B8, partial [Stegodyphus mimosarum]
MRIFFVIALLGITATYATQSIKRFRSVPSETEELVRASNGFGFEILKLLSQSKNVFISPISMSMLIGLVYSGARNITANEIQSVMHYPPNVHAAFKNILGVLKPPEGKMNSAQGYQLEMANAMLVDKFFNILPRYKEESRLFYDAAVESVSFSLHPEAAVDSVNGWVAWRTKNKIVKVLEEPLEPLTKLFLMNAVYFKGTWKTKFDQRLTMPDTFYNDGRVPKTVPMMRQKRKFRYGFEGRIQGHVLELPYSGDDIKMLILLPEKRDGLREMESKLSNNMLEDISTGLREVSVQVTLPRFSLTDEYDLIPILKMLGINSLFDANTADLSGISQKQGLYVTKVVHKCAVEVNEEGSEAAAVTGVSAGVRTGGPLVPLFTADHPFIFFVKDLRFNLTLFLGRVAVL